MKRIIEWLQNRRDRDKNSEKYIYCKQDCVFQDHEFEEGKLYKIASLFYHPDDFLPDLILETEKGLVPLTDIFHCFTKIKNKEVKLHNMEEEEMPKLWCVKGSKSLARYANKKNDINIEGANPERYYYQGTSGKWFYSYSRPFGYQLISFEQFKNFHKNNYTGVVLSKGDYKFIIRNSSEDVRKILIANIPEFISKIKLTKSQLALFYRYCDSSQKDLLDKVLIKK